MTREQFNALIEYIDAAIESKIDDHSSSDEGLVTSIQKYNAHEKLRLLIEKD